MINCFIYFSSCRLRIFYLSFLLEHSCLKLWWTFNSCIMLCGYIWTSPISIWSVLLTLVCSYSYLLLWFEYGVEIVILLLLSTWFHSSVVLDVKIRDWRMLLRHELCCLGHWVHILRLLGRISNEGLGNICLNILVLRMLRREIMTWVHVVGRIKLLLTDHGLHSRVMLLIRHILNTHCRIKILKIHSHLFRAWKEGSSN